LKIGGSLVVAGKDGAAPEAAESADQERDGEPPLHSRHNFGALFGRQSLGLQNWTVSCNIFSTGLVLAGLDECHQL